MGEAVKGIVMNRIKSKIAGKFGDSDGFGMPGGAVGDQGTSKLEQFKSLADDPVQFIQDRFNDRLEEKREQAAGILNPRRMIRNQLIEQGLPEEEIDRILSTMTFARDGEEITETPGVSRGILG